MNVPTLKQKREIIWNYNFILLNKYDILTGLGNDHLFIGI